jgi:hypothetical protein
MHGIFAAQLWSWRDSLYGSFFVGIKIRLNTAFERRWWSAQCRTTYASIRGSRNVHRCLMCGHSGCKTSGVSCSFAAHEGNGNFNLPNDINNLGSDSDDVVQSFNPISASSVSEGNDNETMVRKRRLVVQR